MPVHKHHQYNNISFYTLTFKDSYFQPIDLLSLQGFIIDGYPINQEQADSFCEHIAPPNIVICLTVSNDRALQRLSLNDTSEEQRKYVDKRLEVWNTETKPLGERYNAVFVSAERKCPNEVICEIIQQIRIKTHSSN